MPTQDEASAVGHRLPVRALVLALLVSGGTGAMWFLLAMATGLIFHFLPGATFLAATWTVRWREGATPMPWIGVGIILIGASTATAATLAALVAAVRPLDEPALTATVTLAGAAFATVWMRRPSASKDRIVTQDAAPPQANEVRDR
ncbi:MAG: hypothetical protein ABI578_08935 [Chloroflexota bacterium]